MPIAIGFDHTDHDSTLGTVDRSTCVVAQGLQIDPGPGGSLFRGVSHRVLRYSRASREMSGGTLKPTGRSFERESAATVGLVGYVGHESRVSKDPGARPRLNPMSASSSDSPPHSSSSAGSPAEAVLNVEVNGERRALPAPSSVSTLLEILELAGKRVAVAVNRAVVVRSRYAEVELAEGDRIEILEAVGGG